MEHRFDHIWGPGGAPNTTWKQGTAVLLACIAPSSKLWRRTCPGLAWSKDGWGLPLSSFQMRLHAVNGNSLGISGGFGPASGLAGALGLPLGHGTLASFYWRLLLLSYTSKNNISFWLITCTKTVGPSMGWWWAAKNQKMLILLSSKTFCHWNCWASLKLVTKWCQAHNLRGNRGRNWQDDGSKTLRFCRFAIHLSIWTNIPGPPNQEKKPSKCSERPTNGNNIDFWL